MPSVQCHLLIDRLFVNTYSSTIPRFCALLSVARAAVSDRFAEEIRQSLDCRIGDDAVGWIHLSPDQAGPNWIGSNRKQLQHQR